MDRCKSCGAEIRWVKIEKSGRAMPVNAEALKVVVLGDRMEWKVISGYTSHFATCPDAADWRKAADADDAKKEAVGGAD